jgi:hypothetical protein
MCFRNYPFESNESKPFKKINEMKEDFLSDISNKNKNEQNCKNDFPNYYNKNSNSSFSTTSSLKDL